MLKIVEVHPSLSVAGEYVVLQNTGLTSVSLRGWALCTQTYLGGDAALAGRDMYIFTHDIYIKPYGRVVLFTQSGECGWYPTNDGKSAFVVYWGRSERIWSCAEQVHLLQLAASRRVVQFAGADAYAIS